MNITRDAARSTATTFLLKTHRITDIERERDGELRWAPNSGIVFFSDNFELVEMQAPIAPQRIHYGSLEEQERAERVIKSTQHTIKKLERSGSFDTPE